MSGQARVRCSLWLLRARGAFTDRPLHRFINEQDHGIDARFYITTPKLVVLLNFSISDVRSQLDTGARPTVTVSRKSFSIYFVQRLSEHVNCSIRTAHMNITAVLPDIPSRVPSHSTLITLATGTPLNTVIVRYGNTTHAHTSRAALIRATVIHNYIQPVPVVGCTLARTLTCKIGQFTSLE